MYQEGWTFGKSVGYFEYGYSKQQRADIFHVVIDQTLDAKIKGFNVLVKSINFRLTSGQKSGEKNSKNFRKMRIIHFLK